MPFVEGQSGNPAGMFKRGESGNPEGRPKKIYTLLKQSGYSADDMRTAFGEMAWQTVDDLKEIENDPAKPVILKVLAKAFIRGAEKGDYRYISEIMEQAIGKAKETKETKEDITIRSVEVKVVTTGRKQINSEADID